MGSASSGGGESPAADTQRNEKIAYYTVCTDRRHCNEQLRTKLQVLWVEGQNLRWTKDDRVEAERKPTEAGIHGSECVR